MTRHLVALLASITALGVVVLVSIGPASAHRVACPDTNPLNELVLAGGSGQTAQLGSPFPASLETQLANNNGCPVTGNLAGINVEFDAPASGPSGTFTTSGSRVTTVGTNAQGIAAAPAFTANDLAGSYSVNAHSDYGSVDFNLANTANGVAATITVSNGNGQAATVYSQYATPLQAHVTDATGNPVQGATVSFSVVTGSTGAGGSFLGSSQATATTNASGIATSPSLLANGNPGRFSAIAAVSGLEVAATYTLDNHAATQTLAAAKGTAQSATIDSAYSTPLTVRLLDSSGQPVEGGTVTFTLGASAGGTASTMTTPGATFAGGTSQAAALTDANGIATSPTFTANSVAGAFSATATAAGSTPVAFALRNLPARITLGARSRSATVAKRFRGPLSATVRDTRSRPIRGASVVFTVSMSSGASATFPDGGNQATVVTGANGKAIAPPLMASTTAGTFTVSARIAGSTDLVRNKFRNLAARAASVTVGAASGESTACSRAFLVPLAVTILDRYGNAVSKARVTFSAPLHGATGHFAIKGRRAARTGTPRVTVATNANGIAVAPRFTANQHVGGYLVRATVKGSRAHALFALVNAPRP